MQQNSQFEISKVYDIGLQRYRYQKIRVCVKDSTPLHYSFSSLLLTVNLMICCRLLQLVTHKDYICKSGIARFACMGYLKLRLQSHKIEINASNSSEMFDDFWFAKQQRSSKRYKPTGTARMRGSELVLRNSASILQILWIKDHFVGFMAAQELPLYTEQSRNKRIMRIISS